ncbi:MAG: epoxyqueuosine reductase QueH [Candidatus Margulisiibacteriota bacterium]|jgi:hypothetical protein
MTENKRILLHTCCGPCSIAPVKHLRLKNWEVTAFFYNPNIHPLEEYQRRLQAMDDYARKVTLLLTIHGDYNLNNFLEELSWSGYSKPQRCEMCYALRLDETARFAKVNGYQSFSSTLLYSVYQDHEQIKKICEQKAEQYQIEFYYHDFRAAWQEGQNLSREMQLYRQGHCGCLFSQDERAAEKAKRKEILH